MKKALLILIALVLCTGIGYSQYVEDTLYVRYTETAPEINGEIDAVWDGLDFIEIVEWGEDDDGNPEAPEPTDFKATFKIMWDGIYIYFLGVVVDDIVTEQAAMTTSGAPDWETDSWEFYIAPTNTKLASMDEMTQIRFAYANQSSEDATSGVTAGWSAGGFMNGTSFATAARVMSDAGWILEARFELDPFAAMVDGVTTYQAGDHMGFNITVSDNDEEASRDWIGSWIPDTQWDQADTLGILLLTDMALEVQQETVASKMMIYPNPVADELYFAFEENIEAIEVINTVGATVLRRSNVQDRIDVSELHSGIYFIKVFSDGDLLETSKFLKE